VPERIASVVRFFSAGALLAAALLLVRGTRPRALLALGFLPLVFFPTGWHWRNYEPVCEDRFFYAETPMLRALKETVGEQRVAILGEDSIPPMANLAWRLNLLSNYDGLWVRDYDALYRTTFGETYNWRPIMRGSERALQLMATPWVLAKWNWVFLDSGLGEMRRSKDSQLVRHPILPGRELGQTFHCYEDGLQAVAFFLSVDAQAPQHEYHFELRSRDDGKLIAEQRIGTDEIRSTIYSRDQRPFPLDRGANPAGREVVFRFPPLAHSRDGNFEATLACDDAAPGAGVYGWSFSLLAYGDGRGRSGSEALAGETWFDYSCRLDRFELVKQIGEYGLYRCKDALPMFHAVGGAVHASDDAECLNLLHTGLFDPHNLVVLQDEAGTANGKPDRPGKNVGRLLKPVDSVRVYYLLDDGHSVVWIENESTFVANKFLWKDVRTISSAEFKAYTIVDSDPALARRLGLNTVAPVEPEGSTPTLLEQSPTCYRMRITRANPGWLVISQARYPGWIARIGGREVPLVRANYAFDAIALPPGESEIEFSYEPLSFRLGLWISAASALAGALLFWRLGRR
jgi:hypothetical protein